MKIVKISKSNFQFFLHFIQYLQCHPILQNITCNYGRNYIDFELLVIFNL